MLKLIFPKLYKEMESERNYLQIQNARTEGVIKENRRLSELLTQNNLKLETNNNELNSRIQELDRKLTPTKIKDVLRTLTFNNLKPECIFVNPEESKLLEHCTDVVKKVNSRYIYGIRILKGDTRVNIPFRIKVLDSKVKRVKPLSKQTKLVKGRKK